SLTQSIAVSAISASWTCYPVFKDRAPAAPLRTTNCPPRLATGPRFLPLSAVSCQGPRVPPSPTPHYLQGARHVTPRSAGVTKAPDRLSTSSESPSALSASSRERTSSALRTPDVLGARSLSTAS